MLVPAGAMLFLAFNAGGFYPGPPAYAAAVLCVVLALRVLFAKSPLAGIGWRLAYAAATMALFTLETLLSQEWSHAPGLALVSFVLPLLYLLAMVLFGSVARSRRRLELMMRALAAAIVVVCASGLITRLLPHLWPITANLADNRLSFPLTYWNALGLLAAFGAVLCMHFASDLHERPLVRVLAAAAIPIPACTLYFTFSRGGIAAALVAVAVYALLGRPRALPSTAVAALPPTGVALLVAYHANLLATADPTTPGAIAQGGHVALALGACIIWAAVTRALLLLLDLQLGRLVMPRVLRRHGWLGWIALAAAMLIAAVALHSPISREYHGFLSPGAVGNPGDFRTRLTDPGNDGRIPIWRVAWHGFEAAPVLGNGAGTFANTWAQHRRTSMFVVDAHSLYLEVLDELGIVGLVLLLATILTILVGAARRIRGPRRALYAAVFAVLLAWALHAGIDWDWEMPVLSVIFFALGGAVLARRRTPTASSTSRTNGARRRDDHTPSRRAPARPRFTPQTRALLGLGCLLLAVAPTYVWLSQNKLNAALSAYDSGNCRAATSDALSSISVVGVDAQPYEVLGYCDIRRNRQATALAAIEKAVSLDPNNYNYYVDLAVIRAAAGLDPMPAARKAISLNPYDFVTEEVWQSLRADAPSQWQSDGRQFVSEFTTL